MSLASRRQPAAMWVLTLFSSVALGLQTNGYQQQRVTPKLADVARGATLTFEESCGDAPHHANLMISTLVFEPAWFVKDFLENLLSFTEDSTVIMVHLCAETNYSSEDIKSFNASSNRVIINCNR